MHLFEKKRVFVIFIVIIRSVALFPQMDYAFYDSLYFEMDSVGIANTQRELYISEDAVDQRVTYSANGYIKNDIKNKLSILVGSAVVTYGDIRISADSIVFNMSTNDVFAVGVKDSTGTVNGKPVLDYGDQVFESDTLRYNFRSGKATVKNIVTNQEEGLLRSSVAKMLDDGSLNIYGSTYSTCDADTPHFYIDLNKAKVYPGKKIVSGPANLVFEGVPLPIYLPFAYFPIQTKTAESGLILPRYNYEENRGFALTNGGFYFAASEYFDLSLQGSIYTNGTWLASIGTKYNKRYKYNGNFGFSYANNVSGHRGLEDYRESSNYSLRWSYSQDRKARPGTSFSANVNMSSSGFDKNNSYNVEEHITTTKTSSISYSKSWSGTPFNLTASMNHSQNSSNQTVAMSLPKMTFTVSRIYLFKRKNRVGASKWYEDISIQYTANLNNEIRTYDSLMFTKSVFDDMKNGFTHQIPLSIQFTPFNNFTITPSLTYKGVMYTQKIEKHWDQDNMAVDIDTTKGLFYGQALNPNLTVGYTPQIFGIFEFKNQNMRIKSIRHVMKPSATFSYVPYLDALSTDMYREVRYNEAGDTREYSIFEGSVYGTPSLSSRSGVVSLGLNNVLEAKVSEGPDSLDKVTVKKLVENFNISTSYNIFADSMNWSPVSMTLRTTLAKKISISSSARFSLYGLDENGRSVARYQYSVDKNPLRLTNVSASASFSLSDLIKGNKQTNTQSSGTNPGAGDNGYTGEVGTDDSGYPEFDMPWSMNVSYSMTYSKPKLEPNLSQTVSINGSLSLTGKTNITYRTGYDITNKKLTMTQLSINRDLHCWNMSVNWIPVGNMKSWSFLIRVNASMLSDLKYERKKDYHDN
ncbi:MAG: putative LPS assembly protein LptD [Bacteroidales bacterium]